MSGTGDGDPSPKRYEAPVAAISSLIETASRGPVFPHSATDNGVFLRAAITLNAMQVLLTNDDGIEATGLRVLADALSAIADVTVIAPAEDQSAVGRTLSRTVELTERDSPGSYSAYAVSGTPADCTVAGLYSLCPGADLVVAGCNRGANLSAYTLGRSGTVSAAVEATFFDVPAMAVSLYIPGDRDFEAVATSEDAYAEAARATTYLAEHTSGDGVFEQADYLNVNVPLPEASGDGSSDSGNEGERGSENRNGAGNGSSASMVVTHPSRVCDMDAVREGDSITIHDRIWSRMAENDVPDDAGSDRRVVMNGNVSVSPLTAPHTTERHGALDSLAEEYPSS
jgi:5'-nucleotidase